MCGIVHVKRLDGHRAAKIVRRRYENQKGRGQQGYGFVAMKDGGFASHRRFREEKEIFDAMSQLDATEIMFHHRFPTSTPNLAACAHPIKVSHTHMKYDYYVIHNGVITNAETLRASHEELGFTYTTEIRSVWRGTDGGVSEELAGGMKFNDSEALAIELAMDFDRGEKYDGIGSVRGSIAFICLQVEKETGRTLKLFFGRNSGNPLKCDIKKGRHIIISSEGNGEDLKEDTLHVMDYLTGKITSEPYTIGFTYKYEPVGYRSGASWGATHDSKEGSRQLTLPGPKGYDRDDEESSFHPVSVGEVVDKMAGRDDQPPEDGLGYEDDAYNQYVSDSDELFQVKEAIKKMEEEDAASGLNHNEFALAYLYDKEDELETLCDEYEAKLRSGQA